jgi:hypothetical protein
MGLNNFRTTRGVAGFTDVDATNVDVDTLDALELIDGSGRTRPTAQLQSRSALSAPTNAESVVYARAPVNDEAVQGTESVLTLLQSGINPSMVMRRELDGQGGAYEHQLDAALGRFARVNANLTFEYNTLSDSPNYSTASGGGNYSFSVTSRPRRVRVDHDGSASSNSFGGVISSLITTFDSLGEFSITFSNISVSQNNSDNRARVGATDTGADQDLGGATGNSFFADIAGGEVFNNVNDSGSPSFDGPLGGFSNGQDITLEYDGSSVVLKLDGVRQSELSFSANADFRPVIQLQDNNSNSASEFIEVEQITVEPIGGI